VNTRKLGLLDLVSSGGFCTCIWLGSAGYSDGVWDVHSTGGNGISYFAHGYHHGVRPVIVVNTSDL